MNKTAYEHVVGLVLNLRGMTKTAAPSRYAPQKAPAASPSTYVVQEGDMFEKLDRKYGSPLGTWQKSNPGVVPEKLRIGQRLNVPTIPAQPQPSRTLPVQQKYPEFTPEERAFYDAISYAETGGQSDPWIRTKVRTEVGSTAWGPVQLTRTKADDYFERYKKQLGPGRKFYSNVMLPMYNKFSYYGNEPYKPGFDKRWDYGGYGVRLTPEQQQEYRNMGQMMMMRLDADEVRKNYPNGKPEDILRRRIQKWRGVSEKADPVYYGKVLQYYNNALKQQRQNKGR